MIRRKLQPKNDQRFDLYKATGLCLSVAVIYMLGVSQAYAATPMAEVLCLIMDWMTGNMGKGMATLAVGIVGVGATMGKTSWGLALTVAIGISVLFGAAILVESMGIDVVACT